jgi:hypothetical protein
MTRLRQELHPLRVQRLRERAKQAHSRGEWGQEIGAWRALLNLEPQDTQAQEAIPKAEYNQKYAWMYEIAAQFVEEGLLKPAALQLNILWQDAPDYGDPLGLRTKIKLELPILKQIYHGTCKSARDSSSIPMEIYIKSQDEHGNISVEIIFNKQTDKPSLCEGTVSLRDRNITLTEKRDPNIKYKGVLSLDGSLTGEFIWSGGTIYTWEAK